MSKNSIKLPTYSLFAFTRFSFFTNLPDRFFLYLTLTVVSIAIRMFMLDTLPVAITHDEVFYANQAKSLSFSDTDLSNEWKPTDLTSSHPLFAELPGTIMTPGYLISQNPLFASRFMSAVLGGLLPLILSLIAWQLFAKRKISLIVFLISMFNPWMFQVSRHGFDVIFTLFFFLSGLLALLAFKKYYKLAAIPFFFIGFFQYQAGKVLLVPLLFSALIYFLLKAHKKGKSLFNWSTVSAFIVLALAVGLVGWFSVNLKSQTASSRLGDIIFFDTELLAKKVDLARSNGFPTKITPLVFNKGTVLVKHLATEFIRSIDLQQFFITGEPLRNPTTVWNHGMFYLFDAALIALGLILLAVDKNWRPQAIFLYLLALASFIPQVINTKDTWIFLRLGLLYPVLILFGSVGAYYIWKHVQPRKIVRFSFVTIYAVGILYFAYQWFYVSPVLASSEKYFAERVLASYLQRLPEGQKAEVLSDQSRFVFEEIAFYTNLVTQENKGAIAESIPKEDFRVGNLRVSTDCFDSKKMNDTVIVADSSVVPCIADDESTKIEDKTSGKNEKGIIRSPISGDEIFTVLNDSLCEGRRAESTAILNPKLIQVEKLSDEDFCKAFIIQSVVSQGLTM